MSKSSSPIRRNQSKRVLRAAILSTPAVAAALTFATTAKAVDLYWDTNGDTAGNDFTTAAKIESFLDGKKLAMTGADLPSHPNGFSADVNFGQATQCYVSVEITIAGNVWTTKSVLGTLNGAPNTWRSFVHACV